MNITKSNVAKVVSTTTREILRYRTNNLIEWFCIENELIPLCAEIVLFHPWARPHRARRCVHEMLAFSKQYSVGRRRLGDYLDLTNVNVDAL